MLFQLFLILSVLETNVVWPSHLISSANRTHMGNIYYIHYGSWVIMSVGSFKVAMEFLALVVDMIL